MDHVNNLKLIFSKLGYISQLSEPEIMPIKHGLVIAGRLLDSPASEMPRRMDNSCSAVVLTIFLRMTLQIHSWPAERPNIMFDDETEEANLLS